MDCAAWIVNLLDLQTSAACRRLSVWARRPVVLTRCLRLHLGCSWPHPLLAPCHLRQMSNNYMRWAIGSMNR